MKKFTHFAIKFFTALFLAGPFALHFKDDL
jgi:hypothetical protein